MAPKQNKTKTKLKKKKVWFSPGSFHLGRGIEGKQAKPLHLYFKQRGAKLTKRNRGWRHPHPLGHGAGRKMMGIF